MEEIKAVLKKNDIAGVVVLHTPGFSEFLNSVSPTYSCAKVENGVLKIKGNREHFPDKQAQNDSLKNTSNMLHHLSKITATSALNLLEASKFVDKLVDATHFGGGDISSHESQNN